MLRFQLFRAKVQLPSQVSLLGPEEPNSEVLRQAIMEKPSAEPRQGHTWHIGNISALDSSGLYFALGRTTSSIVETWDQEAENFVEQEFETAPYTHVVVDIPLQVCTIASKSRLAPTIPGIARQLDRLLNNTQIATQRDITFEISEINDPRDLISYLQQAYSISQFSLTFSRPNPWDVNQDFHRPMEQFLQETGGRRGKTSISGEDLSAEVLENIARSVAASGEDAEAKLQFAEDEKAVKKRLGGNPVTLEEEALDTLDEKMSLLDDIRLLYQRVRSRRDSENS